MESPDWCSICRSANKKTVYISAGGTRYHATRHCTALQEGQAMVETPAPVVPAKLGTAAVEGRSPCKTCKPPS